MSNDNLVFVKWAGPNTPYISFNKTDERLCLSKRELLALLVELKAFVNFYKEDFVEPRLSYTTNDEDIQTCQE